LSGLFKESKTLRTIGDPEGTRTLDL